MNPFRTSRRAAHEGIGGIVADLRAVLRRIERLGLPKGEIPSGAELAADNIRDAIEFLELEGGEA